MKPPIPDEKQGTEIQRLANEIYYSSQPCDPERIYELSRLTSPYPYMDFDRVRMRSCLEKHRSFKRQDKKDESWSEVREHAHKIAIITSNARYSHDPAA